eukprot:gnl/MRDRNA2_/MRDRNA2_18846_c0_seq1.p1 gnl/MRDRNA2_/MRDRNA2_18846_c0~~gnl/MRDRNA2_/MRDRNA2_18846_c0_seq1.p1  ORF type:complete len:364 (-),score=56.00 gnl/MRDRNA2_/MRDRNA2_18846_c0_seq1:560-1651(-)
MVIDRVEPIESAYHKLDIEAKLRQSGRRPLALLVVVLTILNSASPICLAAAKQGNADFPFEVVTVVFLTEVCKFIMALTCFLVEINCDPKVLEGGRNHLTFGMFLLFGIPGLLYAFDNNFQYIILDFLQPAELTIIWNFKIVMTAILMRIFLGKHQTLQQWFSLWCLIVGCFLTQADNFFGYFKADPVSMDNASRKVWGTTLGLVGSTIMAAANVISEWLLKVRLQDSIYFQNLQLYFFGICINLVVLLGKLSTTPNSPAHQGLFTGYNTWTWCLLFANSVYGIAISFTLKFVDNIAVVFSHAVALLVVTVVSAAFFNLPVTPQFDIGVVVVAIATVAYYTMGKPEVASGSSSQGLIAGHVSE